MSTKSLLIATFSVVIGILFFGCKREAKEDALLIGWYNTQLRPNLRPLSPPNSSELLGDLAETHGIPLELPFVPDETEASQLDHHCCSEFSNEERAKLIAERIIASNYDIIALGEVFDEDAEDVFVRELENEFPYYIKHLDADFSIGIPSNDSQEGIFLRDEKIRDKFEKCISDTNDLDSCKHLIENEVDGRWGLSGGGWSNDWRQDAGLMLFSKYQFEELKPNDHLVSDDNLIARSNTVKWKSVAGTFFTHCMGWDCAANKGAGLVKIKNPETNRYYYIIFTHLQSGGYSANQHQRYPLVQLVRRTQLDQIEEMMQDVIGSEIDSSEVFIVGDININGSLKNIQPGLMQTNPQNDTCRREWTEVFNTSGSFFADGFEDVWEYQTNTNDLKPVFFDEGITAFKNPLTPQRLAELRDLNNASCSEINSLQPNRIDFIFHDKLGNANFPSHQQLALQQMAIALNLRSGGQESKSAFGSMGEKNLSDHHGIIAEFNHMADYCNPQIANVNPRLLLGDEYATELKGNISVKGGMYWYRFDSIGTYSLAIKSPDAKLDFQVFSSTDLSKPIDPYRKLTRSLIYGDNEMVLAQTFRFNTPVFIRIWNENQMEKGDFSLILKKHECSSLEDVCILIPNDPDPYLYTLRSAVGPEPEFWFRCDTEKANSERPQDLNFFLQPTMLVNSELGLTIEESGNSIGNETFTTGQNIEESINVLGGVPYYLRVKRSFGNTPFEFRIGWKTNLTVFSGYESTNEVVSPTSETQEEFDTNPQTPITIVCERQDDQPDIVEIPLTLFFSINVDVEDDDDIKLILKTVDRNDRDSVYWSNDYGVIRKDWDTKAHHLIYPGFVRFLPDEDLIITLREKDGISNDDLISNCLRIPELAMDQYADYGTVSLWLDGERCGNVLTGGGGGGIAKYTLSYHLYHGVPFIEN